VLAPVASPPIDLRPAALEAYFDQRSYAPGQAAVLRVTGTARRLRLDVLHVGEVAPGRRYGRGLRARTVSARRIVRRGRGTHFTVRVGLGAWPSGVYTARLRDPAGRVAYAPFILRPRRGVHARVAVVMPTNTWQAYNFRDANGDGIGDTWYAGHGISSVELDRPFLRPGLPRWFRYATVPFLRWLERHKLRPDFLADDDLETLSLRTLRRRYGLIVFAGHEEYVTTRVFRSVQAYTAAGGNAMFLSADDFFWRVVRRGSQIVRSGRWRDLGRPESGWIGVQYVDWYRFRWPDAPYRVVGASRAPWLFAGTGLRDGMTFGSYGKEIDQRSASSPRGTMVLAEARGVFGPGRSAQMTFRRTRGGGKIFSAGALDFVNRALLPVESRLLENLWGAMSPASG
jgi:hypothetical protein